MDRRVFLGAAGAWAAGGGLARAEDAALPDPPAAVHPVTLYDLEELESAAAKVLQPGPFAFVAGGWARNGPCTRTAAPSAAM